MKRLIIAIALCVVSALARADGLKLPEPKAQPAPEQRAPDAERQRYVIMRAALFEQMQALIVEQQREIERLRTAKSTGSCI